MISGAIYDWRHSYDDVFYILGVLYAIDAGIFGLIAWMSRRRASFGGSLRQNYDEIGGQNTTQTFKITGMRSVSKSSLANGDAGDLGQGHMTGRSEGAPLSPDSYAPQYSSMAKDPDSHPLAQPPQFTGGQGYGGYPPMGPIHNP